MVSEEKNILLSERDILKICCHGRCRFCEFLDSALIDDPCRDCMNSGRVDNFKFSREALEELLCTK